MNYLKKKENINNLKVLLANETTKILYGKKMADECQITAKETFKGAGVGKGLPEIKISRSLLYNGISILELLSSNKILTSKSEARRAIKSKGIKINDTLVENDNLIVSPKLFENKDFMKISYGKKKHYIIKML